MTEQQEPLHMQGFVVEQEALDTMRRIEQEDLDLNDHLSVWVITGDGVTYTVLVRFTDDAIREEFIQSTSEEQTFMARERALFAEKLEAAELMAHEEA